MYCDVIINLLPVLLYLYLGFVINISLFCAVIWLLLIVLELTKSIHDVYPAKKSTECGLTISRQSSW